MSKEFGERLRSRRLECGMTTTACAAALGITQPAWNQWELGLREPKLDMLSRASQLLACSADWLLGLKDRGSSINAGANSAVAVGANARATSRTTNYQLPTTNTPGEMPACSKCPHLKKLKKLEALLSK